MIGCFNSLAISEKQFNINKHQQQT